MTDKDLKYPPLNDRELRLLLDAAQQAAPEMKQRFSNVCRSSLQAVPRKAQLEFTTEKLSLFRRLSDVFTQPGGWLTGAGLAMAMFFGILVGLNPPDAVLDVTTSISKPKAGDFVGLSDEMELYWENT